MIQTYVLTYISHKGIPEYWFRNSAVEILDCVDDFMFDNGEHDEEPSFGFSLVTLNSNNNIDLDTEFNVENMTWPLKKKFHTLAKKIDKKYGKFNDESPDIFICHECYIFTTTLKCPLCQNDTKK